MVRLQEKRAAEVVTGALSKLHMIEVLRAKMASVKQAGLKVSSLVAELQSQSEVRHHLLLEMVEREREYLQTFYTCPGHKQAKLFRMKLESLDVNCCKNKAILAAFFKKLQVHFLLEFACAKYIQEYASEMKSEKKLSMWLERIKYYYCYHSQLEAKLNKNTSIIDRDQTYLGHRCSSKEQARDVEERLMRDSAKHEQLVKVIDQILANKISDCTICCAKQPKSYLFVPSKIQVHKLISAMAFAADCAHEEHE